MALVERMDLRRLSSSLKTVPPERQHRGVLKTVGDYPRVVYTGFLVERFGRGCVR